MLLFWDFKAKRTTDCIFEITNPKVPMGVKMQAQMVKIKIT